MIDAVYSNETFNLGSHKFFRFNPDQVGKILLTGRKHYMFPPYYYLINYMMDSDEDLFARMKVAPPELKAVLKYVEAVNYKEKDYDPTKNVTVVRPLSRIAEKLYREISSLRTGETLGKDKNQSSELHDFLAEKICSVANTGEENEAYSRYIKKQLSTISMNTLYDQYKNAFYWEGALSMLDMGFQQIKKTDSLAILKKTPFYHFLMDVGKNLAEYAMSMGIHTIDPQSGEDLAETAEYWIKQILYFDKDALLDRFCYLLDLDVEEINLFLVKALKCGRLYEYDTREFLTNLVFISSTPSRERRKTYERLLDYYEKEAPLQKEQDKIPKAMAPAKVIQTNNLTKKNYLGKFEGESLFTKDGEISNAVKQLLAAHVRLKKLYLDTKRKRTSSTRFLNLLRDVRVAYRRETERYLSLFDINDKKDIDASAEKQVKEKGSAIEKIVIVQPVSKESDYGASKKPTPFFTAKKPIFFTENDNIQEVRILNAEEKDKFRFRTCKPRTYIPSKSTKDDVKQCLYLVLKEDKGIDMNQMRFWQEYEYKEKENGVKTTVTGKCEVRIIEMMNYKAALKKNSQEEEDDDKFLEAEKWGAGKICLIPVSEDPDKDVSVTLEDEMTFYGENGISFSVDSGYVDLPITIDSGENVAVEVGVNMVSGKRRIEGMMDYEDPNAPIIMIYNQKTKVGSKDQMVTTVTARTGFVLEKDKFFYQDINVKKEKGFVFEVTEDVDVIPNQGYAILPVVPVLPWSEEEEAYDQKFRQGHSSAYGLPAKVINDPWIQKATFGKNSPELMLKQSEKDDASGFMKVYFTETKEVEIPKQVPKGYRIEAKISIQKLEKQSFKADKDYYFSSIELPVVVTDPEGTKPYYYHHRRAYATGGHDLVSICDAAGQPIPNLRGFFKNTIYAHDDVYTKNYNTESDQEGLKRLLRYLYHGEDFSSISDMVSGLILTDDVIDRFEEYSDFEQRSMFLLLIFLHMSKVIDGDMAIQEMQDIEEKEQNIIKLYKNKIAKTFQGLQFPVYQESYFSDQFFLHILTLEDTDIGDRVQKYQDLLFEELRKA